jgi:hypothetical protein
VYFVTWRPSKTQSVMSWIAEAKAAGAPILTGNRRQGAVRNRHVPR